MAFAIPILIAAAASATTAAILGATLGTILAVAAISAAFAGVAMLLQPRREGSGPVPQSFPSLDSGTKQTFRSPDKARDLVYGQTRVNGTIVFPHTTENNAKLHLVLALAGHESEEIGDLYFGDELVPIGEDGNATGKYAGKVYVEKSLGESTATAFPSLIEAAPDKWTAEHRGDGVTSAYVRLTWNRDLFPNGMPDIWFVLKGRKLYDPRTDETAYSANAALALADYLADSTYSIGAVYGDEIDTTVLAAEASISDEEITLAAGGTEPRYEANGILSSAAKPIDAIAGLLTSCAGQTINVAGKWNILTAAWRAPEIELDESDLREGYTAQNLLASRESFNAIKGKYSNPDKLWQPDDFPAITSAAYEAEDGGEREFKDIELPFTTSATMAQRIARIDLRRARQPITTTWPCKLRGWLLQPGDTVGISDAEMGWSSKPFEVKGTTFVFGDANGPDGGPPLLGVDLVLRETASAIFDHSSSDEITVDPAPNTDLPDVFTVGAPSSLTATEALYSTRDGGGVKAKVTLAWTASNDAFVTSGGAYRASYRASGASTWTYLVDTASLSVEVLDIDPGIYEFRVQAINWAGSASDPLLVTQSVAGLSAAPTLPTNLTVNASGGLAIARWDLSPDLDVREGGGIVFRHSALTSGATWADGTSVAEPLSGNASLAVLPLKAGTYMAKFVDSSGIWSAVATFVQSQASPHTFTTLAGGSLVEAPAFAGTATNCFVSDSELVLGGAGTFDSVPDVDALLSWDFTGGVATAGSYAFASTMDLGSVKRCRLTSAMTAQIRDVFDDFDSRIGEVDDWPSWDGEVSGDEADAVVMVRATADNPSGSPTWGPWQRLDSADFQARGFQFRVDLVSTDPSFSIAISALSVVAEAV